MLLLLFASTGAAIVGIRAYADIAYSLMDDACVGFSLADSGAFGLSTTGGAAVTTSPIDNAGIGIDHTTDANAEES